MISAITMMSDIIITAKYPYRHCSSGMYTKFIPYQPVINVSGRKIVVTMVITAIILFYVHPALIDTVHVSGAHFHEEDVHDFAIVPHGA